MGKLISIGEALIDFIPIQKGVQLKTVNTFERVAGGAPANVCACVSQLGIESVMLTKLGNDAFGDYIMDTLEIAHINTSQIKRTSKALTGLAFVSLKQDGNRDFSFYRKPSADMLLSDEEIDESLFEKDDILHFCSVDLVDAPVRKAHDKAIAYAIKHETIISFDPNIRLPLWDDLKDYKRVVNHYIDYADILKISDEELEFITGYRTIEAAKEVLFRGRVKVLIYTRGKDGAIVYTRDHMYVHRGFQVKTLDTTGAGDSFIGSFIYQLLDHKASIASLEKIDYETYIRFSNATGAIVASKIGAISSMPTKNEVLAFIHGNKSNQR